MSNHEKNWHVVFSIYKEQCLKRAARNKKSQYPLCIYLYNVTKNKEKPEGLISDVKSMRGSYSEKVMPSWAVRKYKMTDLSMFAGRNIDVNINERKGVPTNKGSLCMVVDA